MDELAHSTYAVSLLFDTAFSEAVSALRASLSAALGAAKPSGLMSPVHLTLGMFHATPQALPELQALFSDFAAKEGRSLSLAFCAVDSFKEKVIFLSVDKDTGSYKTLASLNAKLHEALLPHFDPGANFNYVPENFTPHVALAVKLTCAQFHAGMKLLESQEIHLPLSAQVVSVSLARCRPYQELASRELRDTMSPRQRHVTMSHIRSTGGKLETALRSELFRFGFRFRKNDRRLSGSPDIVFPRYRAVIFVNGCFWHAHGWKSEESLICSRQLDEGALFSLRCTKFRMPTTNTDFWYAKFERNRRRDLRDIVMLLDDGWRVGVLWECSIMGRKRSQKIHLAAEKISLWLEEEYSVLFREF